MAAKIRISVAALWLLCGAGACREEPQLPPSLRKKPQAVPQFDARHVALIDADRHLTVSNLTLYILLDPLDSRISGVSLKSAKSPAGGTRLTFGKVVRAESGAGIVNTPLRIVGGRLYRRGGNGVFTRRVAYTPRLVTMQITHLDEQEARGTIGGEFYRWTMPYAAAARPTEVELNMTFVARLVIR